MSLEGTLRLPTPEQPVECADTELILGMLANGMPLMLLPDLAWPGVIAVELPRSRPAPGATVGSAGTTGPVAIIGGTPAARARAEHVGRHAGAAAPENAEERASTCPDSQSGRHRLPLHDRHAADDYARGEGDFSAGQRAC
jgi:hypothetical protein